MSSNPFIWSRAAAAALIAIVSVVGLGCEMPDDFNSDVGPALKAPEPDSLYNRIGGERILRTAVHRYFTLAAADPQLNLSRKGMAGQWDASAGNLAKLEDRYFQFLATALGGNKTYEGQAITSAHEKLNITAREFDRSLELWRQALEQSGIRRPEAEEFIGVLQSLRSAVADVPATQPTRR
jgi:truncated hemoglobin YjbI